VREEIKYLGGEVFRFSSQKLHHVFRRDPLLV
jgi:hypothetical protein